MPQILEGTQLVEDNSVAQVDIRRSWIHPQFNPQWTTFFEFGNQL